MAAAIAASGMAALRAVAVLDQVEYATLEWVDWFNHRRLLEPIGYVPPAEFENRQPTTVA